MNFQARPIASIMCGPMAKSIGRRRFLGSLGLAAAAAGCRTRQDDGVIVLRLSHSMSAGATALHVFGDTFRALAEKATAGAVTIRIFPSGTLGQEREVVQQVQEGLVDFMPCRPGPSSPSRRRRRRRPAGQARQIV